MGLPQQSFPPGFRFHPTDEELFVHYLWRKIRGLKIAEGVIGVIDVYKHEPWDLPEKAILKSRDFEWYFFSSDDRKHGSCWRTSRITPKGFWKATGRDRKVVSGKSFVGVKKSLVFYIGRVPNGERTDWVMYEYRIDEELEISILNGQSFVLCKVRRKGGPGPRIGEQYGAPTNEMDQVDSPLSVNSSGLLQPQPSTTVNENLSIPKKEVDCFNAALDHVKFMGAPLVLDYKPYKVEEQEDDFNVDDFEKEDENDLQIQQLQSITCTTQHERHLVDLTYSEDMSSNNVTNPIEAFHDLVHPSFEEEEILEELLHQAYASNDLLNHDEFVHPVSDQSWLAKGASLQSFSGKSGMNSFIGESTHDESLLDAYLELEDLELPVDDLFPPLGDAIGESETQEDDLAIDGWLQPRTHQILDVKEPLAVGTVAQRARLQIPAVASANMEPAKHNMVINPQDRLTDKGTKQSASLSGKSKVDALEGKGNSIKALLCIGSCDPAHSLMAKQSIADVQLPSQSQCTLSKMLFSIFNEAPVKPAFATDEGINELTCIDDITLFECLQMQARLSSKGAIVSHLREQEQNTTRWLSQSITMARSLFHKVCNFQSRGLRVFLRAVTTVLLLTWLLQEYRMLTISAFSIL